jgi:hypothetical protein
MIKFNKPENFNGREIRAQLNTAGVKIIDSSESVLIDNNGDLWLEIDPQDEAKAKPIVVAHNGTTVTPEPTIERKLSSVGLNLEDLKEALGL